MDSNNVKAHGSFGRGGVSQSSQGSATNIIPQKPPGKKKEPMPAGESERDEQARDWGTWVQCRYGKERELGGQGMVSL